MGVRIPVKRVKLPQSDSVLTWQLHWCSWRPRPGGRPFGPRGSPAIWGRVISGGRSSSHPLFRPLPPLATVNSSKTHSHGHGSFQAPPAPGGQDSREAGALTKRLAGAPANTPTRELESLVSPGPHKASLKVDKRCRKCGGKQRGCETGRGWLESPRGRLHTVVGAAPPR